ncbi:unnamed protein product [Closterium sp. NIES-54]
MHSHLLVSGLPRSLPSLPRSPAPPCLPCVEGRQRAAPHSSEFPPTTAPLQNLYMDLRKRFSQDFPVLRLHSDRGGEFSSDLLAEFCQGEGIVQSFTLPDSPRKNGIAERRIGLIMELNLWPWVSEPDTSPTPRWTGKVGNASVFWVWGALSLVRDPTANKLSSRTLRCVFLGFPTDASPWQFYHPRSRRVFSSQDVTFDESVCYYTLHPHASHPGPSPSDVSLVDLPPLVEPLEVSSHSSGPAEGGDPAADDTAATRRSPRLATPPGFPLRPSSPPPQPAAVDSGAETAGAESGGAEPEGEGPGGATTGGAGSWGAGQPPQPDLLETLSPQAIRAWIVRRGRPGGGGYGPTCAGAASPGGTSDAGGIGCTAGAGGTEGAAGAGGAASAGGTRGAAGAGGAGATSTRGATGAAGAGPTSPGGTASAGGAGGVIV